MKTTKIFEALLVGLMLLCACAHHQVVYQPLSVSKVSYDMALSTAGDLYARGLISDAEKEKIIGIGKQYKAAHNAAVLAYRQFVASGTDSDKLTYEQKLVEASKILSDLLIFIEPYIVKEGE
jgi:hypothetical protein